MQVSGYILPHDEAKAILCLPAFISEAGSFNADLFVAADFDFAFGFFTVAHLPTGAPGSSSQLAQNHSPSGTSWSGGSKH